jgi:hypothetical protein
LLQTESKLMEKVFQEKGDKPGNSKKKSGAR